MYYHSSRAARVLSWWWSSSPSCMILDDDVSVSCTIQKMPARKFVRIIRCSKNCSPSFCLSTARLVSIAQLLLSFTLNARALCTASKKFCETRDNFLRRSIGTYLSRTSTSLHTTIRRSSNNQRTFRPFSTIEIPTIPDRMARTACLTVCPVHQMKIPDTSRMKI